MIRLLRRWLWDQWQLIHDESLAAPAAVEVQTRQVRRRARRAGGGASVPAPVEAAPPDARRRLEWQPIVVLIVTAVSLTLQEYWGERSAYARLVPPPAYAALQSGYWELGSFAWWSGWRVLGYLVLPLVTVLLMPGERLRDYGFAIRGFRKHVWIYVALFLAVLPLVVAVSYTTPFQRTYPFYKLANRSTLDFVAWELLYAAQFLSLEFFFRGFMLHGLKRAIGAHAIWVMIIPYTMIHFGKPMSETLGAIFAGLVLGTLSLRTRSIWCGVLIHVSVALTMDLLALSHCPTDGRCRGH